MATKLPIGRLTESVTFLSSTPPPIAVTSLTAVGTVATVVTGQPHGLTSGDYVSIRGAVPLAFNTMSTQVTVTSPTQFSYDLPTAVAPAYADVVIGDGPSHYWRLNETSGLVAVDLIGGTNGTITGGVTLNQPGALADGSTAMLFNGTTGVVTTTGPVALVPPVTLEFWMRTTSSPTAVLGVQWQPPNPNFDVIVVTRVANYIQLSVLHPPAADASHVYTTDLVINDGLWHHVVWRLTGGTGVQCSVDGVSRNLQGALIHPLVGVTSRPLELGAQTDWFGQHYSGSLDEVAIYPRGLTPAEVLEHYQAASAQGSATGTITVTFQSDSQGGQPDDWYDAGQAFAYIEPLNAAERLAVSAVAATVNYRAVVHYRTNLTPQMKLMWLRYQETDPRELAIFGVYPHPEPAYAHRFLVLECGELA